MSLSAANVTLVEVGLRDGLQNEKQLISLEQKIEMANLLIGSGVSRIELGSFVSAKWVPQMTGSRELIQTIQRQNTKLTKKGAFSALVPNGIGMEQAVQSGVREVAVFISATESFSKKNTNCTIKEALNRAEEVILIAKKKNIKVRGYLSVCFGCPFEGKVSEAKVVALANKLYKMGCYEISIGDTIGIANPGQVKSLFLKLKNVIPLKNLAGHFHDTRGTALVNILTAYNLGVRVFDTSVAGLGGCPYAPGSAGNVATEDVVFMFDGMKVKTGIKIEKLLAMNSWLQKIVQHPLPSKVGKVGLLKPSGKV